jgi:hypothetical protein
MKCIKCGSTNVARERRPNGNDTCGSCHHTWPSSQSNQSTPGDELVKRFSPEELLSQWLEDGNLEAVVIVGLPKIGGWKYGTSNTNFEFLAGAEGVIQKLKLNALLLGSEKAKK